MITLWKQSILENDFKRNFYYSQKEPPKVDLFQDIENLKDAQEYGTVNVILDIL